MGTVVWGHNSVRAQTGLHAFGHNRVGKSNVWTHSQCMGTFAPLLLVNDEY